MRIYTWHSVFCIDLPTFVNSPRAPAVVVSSLCFLSLLLVILELSTDLSARLLYHE
uniref:Uncharacterized protein n=1 Tax=Propithecus coquereli TaxID=379532 RepID=A0A2K6GI31_PROCO